MSIFNPLDELRAAEKSLEEFRRVRRGGRTDYWERFLDAIRLTPMVHDRIADLVEAALVKVVNSRRETARKHLDDAGNEKPEEKPRQKTAKELLDGFYSS